jgi:hypothetical protein
MSGPSVQKEKRRWKRRTKKRVAVRGVLVLQVRVLAEKVPVGVGHPELVFIAPVPLNAIAKIM